MKNINKIIVTLLTCLTIGAFAAPTDWTVNSAQYEYSLTLTATVQMTGGINAAENDMLAAFVNGECRGVTNATYVEAYEKYYFFLTVFSNTYSDEEVELRYYQNVEDSIYTAISSLTFTDGENIGSASEPFLIGDTDASFVLEISNDTISENQPGSTYIGQLLAKENGVQVDFHFALLSHESSFSINTDTLFSSSEFNYEQHNSYTVKIVCFSTDSLTVFEDSVVIKVNDVDEPFELELSNNTIDENNEDEVFIGTVLVTASQKPESQELILDSAYNTDKFILQSDSLYTKQSFNFEESDTYQIKVIAISESADTVSQFFQINIKDVNEAPYNITLSNNAIGENMPSGTFIGSLSAMDEDEGDIITFQQLIPTGEDFTYFTIRNDSVFSYDVFDYEEQAVHNFDVLALDKGELSNEAYFTIQVNDENEVSVMQIESLEFNVFPNPTRNNLNIESDEAFDHVEIYNSKGQLVVGEIHSKFINISSLSTGMYFIKVVSKTKCGFGQFVKN